MTDVGPPPGAKGKQMRQAVDKSNFHRKFHRSAKSGRDCAGIACAITETPVLLSSPPPSTGAQAQLRGVFTLSSVTPDSPRPRDLPDPHCRRCLGSGEVARG